MYRVAKFLLPLMLCLLVSVSNCEAASISGERNWQIPFLGVFRVPAAFQIAEIPDLQTIVDAQTAGLAAVNKVPAAGLPLAGVKAKPQSVRMDIAAYQLTMNDGQSYRQAWLVAVRDRMALEAEALYYFDRPLNVEQRVSAIMMQDKWNQHLEMLQYQDEKTGFGIRIVGFDQLDLGNISGKQAYAAGVRFLINYQEFMIPLYARGWIFNAGGNGGAVLLLTTDSERSFWTPILNSMMSTLQLLPKQNR